MNWINGNKTYIMAAITLVVGVLKYAGVEVPGFEGVSPGNLVDGGLLAGAFRSAMNK